MEEALAKYQEHRISGLNIQKLEVKSIGVAPRRQWSTKGRIRFANKLLPPLLPLTAITTDNSNALAHLPFAIVHTRLLSHDVLVQPYAGHGICLIDPVNSI